MSDQKIIHRIAGKPYQIDYHVTNNRIYIKSEFGEASDFVGIFRPEFVAGVLLQKQLLRARAKKQA